MTFEKLEPKHSQSIVGLMVDFQGHRWVCIDFAESVKLERISSDDAGMVVHRVTMQEIELIDAIQQGKLKVIL